MPKNTWEHFRTPSRAFLGTSGRLLRLSASPGALVTFITGLVLIVIGTGFFKPCVSVMVGQLYGPDAFPFRAQLSAVVDQGGTALYEVK